MGARGHFLSMVSGQGPVEVPGDDARPADRLRHHGHFRERAGAAFAIDALGRLSPHHHRSEDRRGLRLPLLFRLGGKRGRRPARPHCRRRRQAVLCARRGRACHDQARRRRSGAGGGGRRPALFFADHHRAGGRHQRRHSGFLRLGRGGLCARDRLPAARSGDRPRAGAFDRRGLARRRQFSAHARRHHRRTQGDPPAPAHHRPGLDQGPRRRRERLSDACRRR